MRTLKIAGFLFLTLSLFFCVKIERKPSQNAETGGILRVGMIKEPLNLNPLFPPLAERNPFYDLIFQPLFRVEGEEVIPVLAESWEFSEDLKSIVFYLRKGVKWHDGEEFTSRDVLFTYNLIKDPRINSPLQAQLRYVTSVVALDRYRVRFDFSRAYLYELFDCNIYPLPSHILENKDNLEIFSEKPVGSGPYRVKNWIRGDLLELEANENYFLFKPLVQKIYFKFYDSPHTVALAYEQGRIDIALDLTPEEVVYLKERNLNFSSVTGNRVFFLGFNVEKYPYNEINFRKAIGYIINKDDIILKTAKGYVEKTCSPLPPKHWAYDSSLKDIGFNQGKAKELLASMGFRNTDNDPYLELARKDFVVRMLVEDEPFKKEIAEVLRGYFEETGLKCEIEALNPVDFVKRLMEKNFDIYLFSWSMDEKADLIPLWHSKYGVFNFTGFKDQEMDGYLENSILTINQEKSKKNFSMIQKILLEKLPAIYLFVNKNLIAFSPRVKGLENYLTSPISNLDLVWIPKNLQEVALNFEVGIPEEEKKIEEKALPKPSAPPPAAEEILRKELVSKPEEILPPAQEKLTVISPTEEKQPSPAEEKKEELQPVPRPEEPKLVAEAKILNMVQPVYPEEAKKLNLRGLVIIRVLVGKDGRVIKAEVLKSSKYPILDDAALEAAKKFVFEPVRDEGGKPVEFFTSIPFRFP